MTVKGRDELGALALAFNEMAASRGDAEQRRRTMVSDVAHELRTPLGNIRGWLEASREGATPLDPVIMDMLLGQAMQLQHIGPRDLLEQVSARRICRRCSTASGGPRSPVAATPAAPDWA